MLVEGEENDKRPADGPSRHGNRSVVIGLRVLAALAQIGGPATLSNVAKASRLSLSRSHRFLTGLIDADAVRQDANTGRYTLGPAIIQIGLAALRQTDAVKLAADALPELTNQTGLASLIAVWGQSGPTIIRWEYGALNSSIRIQEGGVLPLLTTACGRVFLAHMPEKALEPFIIQEMRRLAKQSPTSMRTRADVKRLREEVLRSGIACSVGEENPAFMAIAAPVRNGRGDLACAISLVTMVGDGAIRTDGEAANKLRSVAQRLSRQLGAA